MNRKTRCCLLALVSVCHAAAAQQVVRPGNITLAHFGAVSYIKEIAPQCGFKVEQHVFAKGLDVMQAIIAGMRTIGLLGLAIDVAMNRLNNHLLRWRRDPSAARFNALKRELGLLVMEEQQRHHHGQLRMAAGA